MVLTALQMRLFEETCENERRIAEHWSDRRLKVLEARAAGF